MKQQSYTQKLEVGKIHFNVNEIYLDKSAGKIT